jgi:prophage regulatory protein
MPIQFIRPRVLNSRRGTSNTTTYRHVAEELLPPPIRIGPNTSVFIEHEIDAIDQARLAGKSDDEIRTLVRQIVAARSANSANNA